MEEIFLFGIIILILSVVVHEVSHGYAAELLGDPTARLAGRLTLNPIKHLDPLGSVIIPFFLVLTSSPILFGWAKPVPYNPYNLKKGKWGPGLVALAGPGSNIFIALVFSLLIRAGLLGESTLALSAMIIYINLILAMFNLLPVPPLDGSKVLGALLPGHLYMKYYRKYETLTMQYGLLVTFIFIFLLIYLILPIFQAIIGVLFEILTGYSLGLLFS